MKTALVPTLLILLTSVAWSQPVAWRPFFTLSPLEGRSFGPERVLAESAGVPGTHVLADGRVVLGYARSQPRRGTMITADSGRTFTPVETTQSPVQPDGAFIYMPDGRIRFIAEEPSPGSTRQRHLSRLISWMSSDGINWTREPGVRYQPGPADDSIASVAAALQIEGGTWRLYYVGDWYRTNGIRTAISTDWGLTWQAESGANVLRRGDVDPHPVYLSDGRVRMYHRRSQPPSGLAYTDGDGVSFDTAGYVLLLPDQPGTRLVLDPSVVRYPDGSTSLFYGLVNPVTGVSQLAERRGGTLSAHVETYGDRGAPGPWPRFIDGALHFWLDERRRVRLTAYDLLGRERGLLLDGVLEQGDHSVSLDAEGTLLIVVGLDERMFGGMVVRR